MMPLGEWLKMNQHDIKIYKDDMKGYTDYKVFGKTFLQLVGSSMK